MRSSKFIIGDKIIVIAKINLAGMMKDNYNYKIHPIGCCGLIENIEPNNDPRIFNSNFYYRVKLINYVSPIGGIGVCCLGENQIIHASTYQYKLALTTKNKYLSRMKGSFNYKLVKY